MSKGIIFDIQEFTLHDGPGIRKTVFFKGCPLKCNWCHNPEGISFDKELMKNNLESFVCGKEYTAEDLAKELLKGRDILDTSGGGITISGGEPLAQPEFLEKLIKLLKFEDIHVAIETSGYAPTDFFTKIVSMVDLTIFDLKHTDSVVHKKYTGVDNKIIINNLKLLSASNNEFILRIPLIPGVNDTKENMKNIAIMLKDAKNLKQVELLPYNLAAGAKYSMLNKQYEPMFDENKKPNVYLEPFNNHNIGVIYCD